VGLKNCPLFMGAYKLLAATENMYTAVITELQHLDKFLRRVKWLTNFNDYISSRRSNLGRASPVAVKIVHLAYNIYNPKAAGGAFTSTHRTY